ncbi:hypothetical protein HYW32_01810 [Candidatus Berkelbacteria bacterium]|nr:hypothetical protein [Candidatus Berkelbacteria bacterium]
MQPKLYNSRSFIFRLLTSLTRVEKMTMAILFLVVLLSTSALGYRYWIKKTTQQPVSGGTYTEGIVASSLADIQSTLDVLTNIGFVRYGQENQFEPAAAKSWEVSDDGKTYIFQMDTAIDKSTTQAALDRNKETFKDIDIEVTDDQRVIFNLKQSFTPFLATTAIPIFPLGPYEITEQERGIVRLRPRSNAFASTPYLQELILRIYADTFNLTRALSVGDIQGVADISMIENEHLLEPLKVFQIEVPRKIYLFFNTEKDELKKEAVRKNLKDGTALAQTLEIKLVTLANPKNERIAQEIVERWQPLGVRVIVETHTATELAKDVVPNRNYDALIYGLDFGGDPDPYPFWHSSQISPTGLNLSNFANIDADRILEKARQTVEVSEREKLYDQFDEIFERLVPAIELEQVSVSFAVDKGIQGAKSQPGLSVADRFSNIAEWYRKSRRKPVE